MTAPVSETIGSLVIVAVNVPLAKFVSVTAPLKSPPSVIVGSAVAVVLMLIAPLPSKFAVPVTAPLTSIALAVVRSGKNMMCKKLFIPMEDRTINVTIVDPIFLDKENKRLNA